MGVVMECHTYVVISNVGKKGEFVCHAHDIAEILYVHIHIKIEGGHDKPFGLNNGQIYLVMIGKCDGGVYEPFPLSDFVGAGDVGGSQFFVQ